MKFYLTFGQKYRREEHPCGGHPDGWFEIEAHTLSEARSKANSAMGEKWGFIYTEESFNKGYFAKGKIGEL